jgi:hypothetical protein
MSKDVELFERDHTRLYNKAMANGFLAGRFFRRRCLANLNWAIGGSWWKLAGKRFHAIPYFVRAIGHWPGVVVRPIKKRLDPWV